MSYCQHQINRSCQFDLSVIDLRFWGFISKTITYVKCEHIVDVYFKKCVETLPVDPDLFSQQSYKPSHNSRKEQKGTDSIGAGVAQQAVEVLK